MVFITVMNTFQTGGMMKSLLLKLVVLVAVGLMLSISGCGGDDESKDEAQSTEDTTTVSTPQPLHEDIATADIKHEDETMPSAISEEVRQTYTEELSKALDDAINLASAGDIHGLFKEFTPPEVYTALDTSGQLAGAEGRFKIFKDQFVEAMKVAKTVEPEFYDGSKAAFAVEDVPGGQVRFQRIDGKWYFSD
jgi:hypothetical protein